MRHVDHHLALASGQTVFRDPFLLMGDADSSTIQLLPHRHRLADIAVRHRVTIAAIADKAVLGGLPMADVAGVVVGVPSDR